MKAIPFFVLLLVAHVSAGAAPLPQEKVAAIEQLVTAYMVKQSVPGLSIAIVKDGQLAWSNGYGHADLENLVPARPTTAYRSASIGKTMTATAAMMLVEEGRLDLQADIRRYCPAFPAKPRTITPMQLLTHTSGIRHYGGPRDREENLSNVHYESVADALAPFKNDALMFEPGTKYLYSTYGYDVLGCVIEGASGTPFLTTMRTRLWDRAGMKNTRDDDPAAIVTNRAAGYTRVAGELRKAPFVDMSNRLPAGGYLTTVIDLAHFAEALVADKLIKRETLQRMIAPTKLPGGEVVGYGLGWGVEPEEWHGDAWMFHGGSSPGASGILVMMPRHRFAAAVLTNLDELPGRGELLEQIARIVLDFTPAAQ